MTDIIDPRHEALVEHLFRRVLAVLEMPGFEFRAMRRRTRGKGRLRSVVYGYTRLTEKLVTIDLYTPHTMKPRKMDAIMRVIAHELAHHQEPPKLYRHWFRLVRIIHHPPFWAQYKRNVAKLQEDELLKEHFGPIPAE
jgi:predicted SprT family Zn-dependent metalloprotease